MARYLFTQWPFPGHVNPNIAVAEVLRARGHEVAFYTGAAASGLLADLGITHFPMHHIDEEALYRRYRFLEHDDGDGHAFSVREWRRLQATLHGVTIGTIPSQLADLEPILDRWQPDAIICEEGLLAPYVVLHQARSIPVAILLLAIGCMIPGPDAPLWGRGLPPPTTASRRIRAEIEAAIARPMTRGFRQAVSAYRARYGLAPLTTSVREYAGTMPLYLVHGVRELDYNRQDLPPCVHYVGRCAWDRPATQPPPAWLDALPTDRPLVYVTEGTLHGKRPKLLRAAAQALANLPLHAVMTFNADRDPVEAGLASLAHNVQVQPYTPGYGWQSDVLERASLVITNGGSGSVLAALSAGVPLIVVPTSWDKPENAQRVVAAGAGVQIAPKSCTPDRLRAAVQEVLGEPRYRANAQRLATALARAGGAARAAALLEGLGVASRHAGPQALTVSGSEGSFGGGQHAGKRMP